MKKNIAFNPINISLLCAQTIMLEPQLIAHYIQYLCALSEVTLSGKLGWDIRFKQIKNS